MNTLDKKVVAENQKKGFKPVISTHIVKQDIRPVLRNLTPYEKILVKGLRSSYNGVKLTSPGHKLKAHVEIGESTTIPNAYFVEKENYFYKKSKDGNLEMYFHRK